MAKPVKVVRLITRLNIGGPAIHTILLTARLNPSRFRSLLVTGTEGTTEGNMLPLAARLGVRPIVIPELGRAVRPGQDLVAFARVLRLLQAERPTIVHTHMAKAGAIGRLAARIARVPIVVHTYHGHVFHSYFGPLTSRALRAVEQALARLSDSLVAVGERQRAEIVAYGVGGAPRVVSIPLGLELEPFLVAQRSGALRRELGLAPTTPLVGIVARLVPVKAHADFLQAAALLHQTQPAARFLVVGDGDDRQALERLCRRLGLQDVVHFLGWRRDLPAIYADLDVVCLTSLNEGSPVAIIEAMAAARPVVATAVGGVPEVVRDHITGLLVPPRQPAALAAAVAEVLGDASRARAMGLAARDAVYPKYAASRLVDDVERLYLGLLQAKGLA
jgi:glycosyltransferase involved in cell wall biosynthesis